MSKDMDLTTIVEKVLRQYPETRDSDSKLIYCVYRLYGLPMRSTFEYVVSELIQGNLPAFASITRAKRKLVETYPELDANATVKAYRAQQEAMYEEYARRW